MRAIIPNLAQQQSKSALPHDAVVGSGSYLLRVRYFCTGYYPQNLFATGAYAQFSPKKVQQLVPDAEGRDAENTIKTEDAAKTRGSSVTVEDAGKSSSPKSSSPRHGRRRGRRGRGTTSPPAPAPAAPTTTATSSTSVALAVVGVPPAGPASSSGTSSIKNPGSDQNLHDAVTFSAKSPAGEASTSGATTTAPGPTTSSSSRLYFNRPRPGKMLATSSIVRDKDHRPPQSQPRVDEDGSTTSIEWNNQRCSDVFSSYQYQNVPLHPSSGTVVRRITEYGAASSSTTGYFAGTASSPVPSASSFFNQPNHVAAQRKTSSWNYNSYSEYDPTTSPLNEDEVGFYSSFSGVQPENNNINSFHTSAGASGRHQMTYGAPPVAPPPPGAAVLHNSSTSMLQHQDAIDAHHPPAAPSFISNYEERLYYDYQGLMHPQQSSTMLQGTSSHQDFLHTTTTAEEQQGAGMIFPGAGTPMQSWEQFKELQELHEARVKARNALAAYESSWEYGSVRIEIVKVEIICNA